MINYITTCKIFDKSNIQVITNPHQISINIIQISYNNDKIAINIILIIIFFSFPIILLIDHKTH